jgi:type VI protein secretion system component VasK
VSQQPFGLAAADPAGVWAAAIGTAGVFVVLIVLVWQIAATWRARMLAAREEQYKELARKYAELLEDNVELHRRSIEELTTARRSIDSLERKMMREVE